MKPGYKKTEVGVIPEEWRDCDISDLCQFQRGFDLTEATRKSGDVPVYSSSGLSYFHNEVRLKPPAVITGRKGMLGKVFFVDEPCWPHDTTLWVKDFKGNHPQFVALFLGEFRLERFDAATSVPTLNRNNVVGVPIILPPLPEQRAIAAALSEVDALLAALDRLIAKKRDLKQAAMQQLLTGQTRLPGFEGEWVVKRLGDVADFFKGKGSPKSAISESGVEHCVHYGELFTTYSETIGEIHSRTNLSAGTFRSIANDLLMPTSDVTPRGLAKASCIMVDGVILGGDILVIRCEKSAVHGPFLSLLIRYEEAQVLQLVTGSTVYHLYGSDMKNFGVVLPPVAEQTAIAAVLSDMDAELAALEQRREKTRALKQGMMQELLTGRTRLV